MALCGQTKFEIDMGEGGGEIDREREKLKCCPVTAPCFLHLSNICTKQSFVSFGGYVFDVTSVLKSCSLESGSSVR
jgi:hypothetical protein